MSDRKPRDRSKKSSEPPPDAKTSEQASDDALDAFLEDDVEGYAPTAAGGADASKRPPPLPPRTKRPAEVKRTPVGLGPSPVAAKPPAAIASAPPPPVGRRPVSVPPPIVGGRAAPPVQVQARPRSLPPVGAAVPAVPAASAPPPATAPTVARSVPPRAGGGTVVIKPQGQPRAAPPETPPLRAELRMRAERLKTRDTLSSARAYVELGVHEEYAQKDRKAARKCYESARGLSRTLPSAQTRLRRVLDGKPDLAVALDIVSDEIAGGEDETHKAAMLAQKGRISEQLGKIADARKAYVDALAVAPRHASSLRGLESLLDREIARLPPPGARGAQSPDAPRAARAEARSSDAPAALLATHLERVVAVLAPSTEGSPDAASPESEPRLAAWLEVERGELLDQALEQHDAARAAFEHALALDPSSGPVRDAYNRHLLRHGTTQVLVESLSVEARSETDDHRAARLLYTAGRLLLDRVSQPAAAIGLLQQAAGRISAASNADPGGAARLASTRRRIFTSLAPLLEASGDLAGAAEARLAYLPELREAEAIAHEHIALADIFAALGDHERAVEHARAALARDPLDASAQERLDRALERLGRHEERITAWVLQGNAKRPVPMRVAAFLRAADIARTALGSRELAMMHLRAAWVIDPGGGEVFDALSGLIAPPVRDPEADMRGAQDRIDLFTQAAHVAKTPARKVALLEKVAHIWEDELAMPERALDTIERILELDATRHSAILALGRSAARAGDARRLVRAQIAEAALTSDRALSRRLLLRAAEITAEQLSDRDQALALVDQALAPDPNEPDALRLRCRLLEKAGRFDEARRSLIVLAGRGHDTAFATWVEIARLDEHVRKRPEDAVMAFQEAARIKPRHPLPQLEIVRLLRQIGDFSRLADAVRALVDIAIEPMDASRLLFELAEVQELRLGNDTAALESLAHAETVLGNDAASDPALVESMERILVRRGSSLELVKLYELWLRRELPSGEARRLRIKLGKVLADIDRKHAVRVLEELLETSPGDLSSLRLLERLQRAIGANDALATIVRAEAEVLSSRVGRCFALWELAQHEDTIDAEVVLTGLERITEEIPTDVDAFDTVIRLSSKLASNDGAPPTMRPRLVRALDGRKALASEPITRAAYEVELGVLAEDAAGEDPTALAAVVAAYERALSLWPDSLLAARGLERVARRLNERDAGITAQLALAKMVEAPALRAEHLVRAAELTERIGTSDARTRALAIFEEALAADADNAAAATALGARLASDTARLAERLGAALDRARTSDQIVRLGRAIGHAALHPSSPGAGPDPSVGIAAMRRVLAETPDELDILRTMATLLVTQKLWREAEGILRRVAAVAPDKETAVGAHFDVAALFEGPLSDPAAAQGALEQVLAIDPNNRVAIERLQQLAVARGDRQRATRFIEQLIQTEKDPGRRLGYELQLAATLRDSGDRDAAVRALCNALVTQPADPRAWSALAAMHKTDTPEAALGYVKTLRLLLEIATARRAPVEPRWLATLGLLEVTSLRKQDDGLKRLRSAAAMPNATTDVHVALGRALEAAGRSDEAITVLRDALGRDTQAPMTLAELTPALAALGAAHAGLGHLDARQSVDEVRCLLGEEPAKLRRFRARPLAADAPYPDSLAGEELARLVVTEARNPMVDVARALAPVAAKALRFQLSKLGVTSRERLGPRDGHPVRMLADRIARALGVEGFELYLSATWQGAARVYPGDPPAIIGPTDFGDLPEPELAFALARLLTRIVLGFTWLDELPLEAADALLLATVRAAVPSFGRGELPAERDGMVDRLVPAVEKAISRRQRKLVEAIAPTIDARYDARAFLIGVRRTEYRAAYVISGNLTASIDYLRRFDPALARSSDEPRLLLEHPVTNELLRYSLSAEAYAERRRIGTLGTSQ